MDPQSVLAWLAAQERRQALAQEKLLRERREHSLKVVAMLACGGDAAMECQANDLATQCTIGGLKEDDHKAEELVSTERLLCSHTGTVACLEELGDVDRAAGDGSPYNHPLKSDGGELVHESDKRHDGSALHVAGGGDLRGSTREEGGGGHVRRMTLLYDKSGGSTSTLSSSHVEFGATKVDGYGSGDAAESPRRN